MWFTTIQLSTAGRCWPGLERGADPSHIHLGIVEPGPALATSWVEPGPDRPRPPRSCCEQEEPTYFAIWGDNKAFNEVIISPAMLHEHLPYVVMEGLNKVSTGAAQALGPRPSPGAGTTPALRLPTGQRALWPCFQARGGTGRASHPRC